MNAANLTMRADRRFLWLWLTIATSLSVAGNVGHAWLTVSQGAARWAAIGWATVPPILLMLAVHGIPVLARMLGVEKNDKMLNCVAWGVVAVAFGWSATGIYAFTVSTGTPPQLAWLAPVGIDLSVFGATRGLVLTAPLAARMKLGEKQPAPTKKQPAQQPASLGRVSAKQVEPSGEASTLAQRIAASAAAKVSEKQIAEILALTKEGESQRKIAEAVGTNSTTVGRIQNKARELVAA